LSQSLCLLANVFYSAEALFIFKIYVLFQITVTEKNKCMFFQSGSVDVLHCYYAHGEDNENFQRRSYWLLEEWVLESFHFWSSNILVLDLNTCISNYSSGLIRTMVYKVAYLAIVKKIGLVLTCWYMCISHWINSFHFILFYERLILWLFHILLLGFN
jgi:hypothetical protein